MATLKTFEELEIWQKARSMTIKIYKITNQPCFAKDFVLRNQLRKASISVMSNIAEGFERSGTKEFIQFLAVAKGSLGEIKSQLYIALDQEYITKEAFCILNKEVSEIGKMVGGFMNYLQKSNMKGIKYKNQ